MYGSNPQLSAFLANERRAELARARGVHRRARRSSRPRTWFGTLFVR
ncbi:MAG TPA: hypothetical protein VFZ83_11770 [Acidimicrobiia bacterium]|nr:hypothetical protein [Acidimicrobiia bacterium]